MYLRCIRGILKTVSDLDLNLVHVLDQVDDTVGVSPLQVRRRRRRIRRCISIRMDLVNRNNLRENLCPHSPHNHDSHFITKQH